jgi:TP901 family phage tail tape measure protein
MADIESNIDININADQALASIKRLQAEISAFHQAMSKGSAKAAQEAALLQQQLVNSINATGKFSATMQTVSTSTESFTTALEKNKLSMGQYFKYAVASTQGFGKVFRTEFDTIEKVARERVKTLQTQYIKLGRDANGAMKAISVRPLALDMEDLGTKVAITAQKQQLLNQLLKQGSTNLLNFGKNTQWAGRQLMVGFTVPLTIFGATAAREFMKLEEQAIRFKRVYGDSMTPSDETDKMIQQIRDLSSEFTKYGVSVEKTMSLAADAAAMGKQGADLIAQVTEANKLAVLGGVDQAAALETTTSLTNAFGVAADQLSGKINFLNAVENQTVTSIEDLTEAIPKAGPVVQQLGGDVEDLAFFLTAMKEGGIDAAEGANALKSGLASMINPTKEATDQLGSMGINLKAIVDNNAGNVKNMVTGLATELDTLTSIDRAKAIETLFGKFQFARMSTLFQNVIAEGSQASRVLELTNASTQELAILAEREMKRIEDSPMYKFQKVMEDLKATLAPIGEAFLKAVTPIIEWGSGVLKSFNNMGEGAKQFLTIAVAAIAGLGPVLLMTFGLMANGIANIIKMFGVMGGLFGKLSGQSTTLGLDTQYMTQEQLEAAAVASSLNQTHQSLVQTFTSEATAVNALAGAYRNAAVAIQGVQRPMMPAAPMPGAGGTKKYANGVYSVPGPKGAGDIVPAMLAPGEAVIPADKADKYRGLIQGIIGGKIPGFAEGEVKVNAPKGAGFNQSHFSGSSRMTGQELLDWSATQPESVQIKLRKKLDDQLKYFANEQEMLAYEFQTYTNEVVNMSADINNRLGQSSTGNEKAVVPAGEIKADFSRTREQAHGEAARLMEEAGVPADRIKQVLGQLADEIDSGLTAFGDEVEMTGDDLDAVISSAYDRVQATSSELDAARTKMGKTSGFLSARPGHNTRVGVTTDESPTTFYQDRREENKAAAERYSDRTPVFADKASINFAGSQARQDKQLFQDLAEVDRQAAIDIVNAQKEDRVSMLREAAAKAGLGTPGTSGATAVTPRQDAVDDVKEYQTTVEAQTPEDLYPKIGRKRNSPHEQVGKDAKDDVEEYQRVADKEAKKAGRKSGGKIDPAAAQRIRDEVKAAQAEEDRRLGISAGGPAPVVVPPRKPKTLVTGEVAMTDVENATRRGQRESGMLDGSGSPTADRIAAKLSGGLDWVRGKAPKLAAVIDNKLNDLDKMLDLEGRHQAEAEAVQKRAIIAQEKVALALEAEAARMSAAGETGPVSVDPSKVLSRKELLAYEKAQEDEKIRNQKDLARQKRQKRAQAIGTAGAVASTAIGMMSMAGGDLGNFAQAVGPAVLAFSTVGPMLAAMPPQAAIAVGAIGALVAAFVAIKTNLDNIRSEAMKTAEALGTSEVALRKYAEFANKVTAGEIKDRERAAQATGYGVQTGKGSFGLSFMQSEQGKGLLESVKTAKKGGMDTQSMMVNQMMAAVSSGALDITQARSVIAQLATEMGDYDFGIKVNGELSNILGPNGENILKDPIGVRVRMIDERNSQLNKGANRISEVAAGGASAQTALGGVVAGAGAIAGITGATAGMIAFGGAVTGAALGTSSIAATFLGLSAAAGPIGLAVAGVAALGLGVWAAYDGTQKLESASAAYVAQGVMALQNNQEILDSLDIEYQKKIEIAKAAGDQAEAERLTNEYLNGRNEVLAANARTMTSMSDSFAGADFAARGAMGRSLDTAIENTYKDDALAQMTAIEARNQIVAATADTQQGNKNEYTMKLMLASGDVDPGLMLSLVETFKDSEADMTAMVTYMTNLGTAEGARLMKTIGAFQNADGTPNTQAQKTFTANFVEGKAPEETKKYLDLFEEISKGESAGLEIGAALNFYNEDPAAAEEAADQLAQLREQAKQGPISLDYIVTLYGQEVGDIIASNQAYFESLPPDQQVVYTTVLKTVRIGVGAAGDKTDDRKAYINWAKAQGYTVSGKGGTQSWNDASTENQYINQKAEEVTKANMAAQQAQEAAADTGPAAGGGGGGPQSSMLDDLLKKLKQVQMNALEVTKGWAASRTALDNLFPGGGSNSPFNGIEQAMRRLGANEPLINLIAGMDPDEFKKRKDELFTFDENGNIAGFRESLLSISAALRSIAFGEFQSKQQKSIATVNDQSVAMRKLVSVGMSTADAYAIVSDATMAASIAQESNLDIVRQSVALYRESEKAIKDQAAAQAVASKNQQTVDKRALTSFLAANAGNYTDKQMQAILSDENLQRLVLTPGIDPATLEQALKDAENAADLEIDVKKLTLKGMEEIFNDGFSKAMEAFAAQEQAIDIKFKAKTDPLNDIITAAQQAIEDIQNRAGGMDDLEADLTRIGEKEKEINDKYTERNEALDKVRTANEALVSQQKAQLTLADALSQGDISAAAKAVQDQRAQASSDAIANQQKILDSARQLELDNLVGQMGLTRKQIEEQILSLRTQIFNIEEQMIEPATRQIALLDRQKKIEIDSLTVLGKTKQEWQNIKAKIELAKTSSKEYKEAMEQALGVVQGILDKWTEIEKPKTTVHTIITRNITEGDPAGNIGVSGDTVGGPGSGSEQETGAPGGGPGGAAASGKKTSSQWNSMAGSSDYANLSKRWKAMQDVTNPMGQPRIQVQKLWDEYVWWNKTANTPMKQKKIADLKAGFTKYGYNTGGLISGIGNKDKISAMLTPGEFVITKPAVQAFGASNLSDINNGKFSTGSMYNNTYNISVDVRDGNANNIAKAVVAQIKQADSQRIRGNRF